MTLKEQRIRYLQAELIEERGCPSLDYLEKKLSNGELLWLLMAVTLSKKYSMKYVLKKQEEKIRRIETHHNACRRELESEIKRLKGEGKSEYE